MSEIVFLSEIVDQSFLLKNAKGALNDDNDNWKKAMRDKYNSLIENKVWDLVEDNGAKEVGSRWHFGVKYNPTGEISRFKARFVAKGYSQVLGKNYHETYSPTTRLSAIRLLVSLSVQKGSKIRQMDIKTAYLNAPIAEEIYMKQPEGFEQLDNIWKLLVCSMKKSHYGLKESERNWYRTFRNFLVAKGFEFSVHGNCLFIKRSERQLQGAVCLWVDDIISCEFQENFSSLFESELSKDLKISDCRDLCWTNLKRENSIEINREQYIEKLLERFGLESCISVERPLAEIELTREDCPQDGSEEQERMKNLDYRN